MWEELLLDNGKFEKNNGKPLMDELRLMKMNNCIYLFIFIKVVSSKETYIGSFLHKQNYKIKAIIISQLKNLRNNFKLLTRNILGPFVLDFFTKNLFFDLKK